MNDRDDLIRVQQDLKNSIQNHAQMMTDMRTIFDRIEKDSKTVTTLSADLKYMNDRIKVLEELEDKVAKEREERIKAIDEEIRERQNFETTVNSSVKTIKVIAGILGTLATILGGVAVALQILEKI